MDSNLENVAAGAQGTQSKDKAPATRAYEPDFCNEVYEKVDCGSEIKQCMQCGVCGATCPLRDQMVYGPRQLWMLIRAGRREQVLNCPDIMLCTSCYTCKVRCPRGVRVIDVMHGLANYAIKQGIMPREETVKFGRVFWKSIYKKGRVDETAVGQGYALADGLVKGIKNGLEMAPMGLAMVTHKRMGLLPVRAIKGIKDLQKMLDKAAQMTGEEA
ncbi:putative heterodisulfide reductase, C subunit [Desulfarculus baarsii DSM 2075]|uniref:Heterodisulfide reductase, C subunit n=1 Tax=Desulfarculus baarsii (strain ATCC 33931 / DSM 2075 / LMG 7858 / VKM B-1802 / 2st14) TaxID=644282 RepID=E1QFL9_DESB2|nr:putative heterodisulfide reductase, C subunit [Desulfarculus baarsii DSM 2075]